MQTSKRGTWLLAAAVLWPSWTVAQADGNNVVQVVEAGSEAPVAGVTARWVSGESVTDGAGRLTLPALPRAVEVSFERLGYAGRTVRAGDLGGRVVLVPEAVLLDAIPVSARRERLAAGTALTVTGVDAEGLAAGDHASVAEALAAVQGVSVSSVGRWGARPVLRGLSGERVAVLIDGNRVNRACAFGMDQGLATVDPATVERVEVLSGPGSTLYGSGNVGGVINVVTRHPVPKAGALTGEVRAGASSAGRGGTLGGTLAYGAGPLDASVSVDGTDHGDYRAPTGDVEGSGFRHGTAALRLAFRPAAGSRLALNAQAYEGRDIGWPAVQGAEIPSESRRSAALDWGRQLGGVVDAVSARAYIQRLDHHMTMEMVMTEPMPMTMLTQQRSHSTTSGGRVQARLRPLPASHLDVGLEATEWAAESSRWTERNGEAVVATYHTWPAVSILDVGLFGQGEVELGPLTASAGARLDRVDRSADGWSGSVEWVQSGNVGVGADLPAGFGARASLGFGYRIPDATELFGLAQKADGFIYRGNPDLLTERNRNVEASLTADRGPLSASVTVFHNSLTDLITPVLVDGEVVNGREVRTYANLAEATLVGASATTRLGLGRGLDVRGGIQHTRGENAATGEPLPMIPPLEGDLALRAGFGDAWIEVEGRAAGRQDRFAGAAGEVATAGYGVLDVRGSFVLVDTRITLGIDNVLDHAYRAHVDPRSLLRPGRSLYVRLSRAFGP